MDGSETNGDSMRRLEGVVASAMDAIITVDEAQRIILFNPAAERMFGVSAKEALGRHIEMFVPERFRGVHGQHIARFREAGATSRRMGALGAISGLRANGQEFPLEASISQVDVGGERLATVILRDITERKATEDALRESRRRMEGIVESAMDAIITIDEQQRVVLFNPAAERMFGVAAAAALGQPITSFIPERFHATHASHIERFGQTGVTTRGMGALGAVSGVRANGEEFPVEASISQVEVSGERLSTVILRDITERKQNEEARVLLAREVDHRAKNALAVAQSLMKLTKAATKEEYIEAVQGRMSALVRAHSLLSQGSWQGAEFAKVMGDELAAYAKPGQVRLSGPPVTLLANAVQPVSLVVHELATNAVKHGALRETAGALEVRWRIEPDARLQLEWEESGGPPVAPPTTRGFGSTLLREVVTKQLEGEIDTDWRADGVKVRIRFGPAMFRIEKNVTSRSDSVSPASPIAIQTAHAPGEKGSLLLVEDESLVAMELQADLVRCGWKVVGPAYSLRDAFAILDAGTAFDVAVLDVNLAGRAVYPLAARLQDRGAPFVFCTGYEMVDPDGRFPDVPILRKPVNINLLERELDLLLETPPIQRRKSAS